VKVLLFGATGMVGAGVLLECLDDHRVESVLSIGRSPTGLVHPKLREVLRSDFFRFDDLRGQLAECDACFFCLGVTSVGLDEAVYTRLTYDLTLAAAQALVAANRNATFCYVSGLGTDSTERGRRMWARIKGRTENALLALGFKAAYMFRPGYIQPMRGVRSKTGWYQVLYSVMAPAYPLLHGLFPSQTTTTVNLGRAMLRVVIGESPQRILHSREINALAESLASR
jgi:uncharacterized protein YbjT (DUF2867 family)